MPKKPKKAALNYPQGSLPPPEKITPDTPTPTEDWLAKNSRAKAIIMSTLIPGSEPWKIAEPLEYAADIWKALEDRYAPKNDPEGNRLERADFVNDWVEGKSMDKYRDGPKKGSMLTDFPAEALNPEATSKLNERGLAISGFKRPQNPQFASTVKTLNEEREAFKREQRRKTINALNEEREAFNNEKARKMAQQAAARVMAEHMPDRDQRFLWALLHGGKEETMNWFNGTTSMPTGDK